VKTYPKILLIFLFVVALSSCVTSKRVNYMQEPSKTIPSYTDTLYYNDYQIRKGDRLYVQVYAIDESVSRLFNGGLNLQNIRNSSHNSDLYTYLVDESGNMKFPLIDTIHVQGLTAREVKRLLEDKIIEVSPLKGGMKTISVEVQLVQRYFSVIGANGSGQYSIPKEKLTIFEAIAMAGNITDIGDRSCVHIVREAEDSTIVKTFDMRSKDIINSEYYYVEPNDVIYVQKIKGYSFGMNHVTTAISTVATTISFAVFVYTIVQTGINHVRKYYPKE